MKNWIIKENCFEKKDITKNGNRFLCGNGYMGIRGTLEEYDKEFLPAVNLAGIYDKAGDGWREPLNAPNPLYTRIKADGEYYMLPDAPCDEHTQELDFRHGIMRRYTVFNTEKGKITVSSERFVHMARKHIICMKYEIRTENAIELELETGIDGDVWDINGPHYVSLDFFCENEEITACAYTNESNDSVIVKEHCEINTPVREKDFYEKDRRMIRRYVFDTKKEMPVFIWKTACVYTSKDAGKPEMNANQDIQEALKEQYETLYNEHSAAWEKLWQISEVKIEGDDEADKSVNYSIYHLMSIAPAHSKSMSIAARGLSGQTYKGAVFWDTEMFMLDFFINTQPELAETLLKYRVDTLEGARAKAGHYGYEGAFYAWESQEGGFDACSDYNVTDVFTNRPMRTFFKDKQVHISSAVVYGIMKYVNTTQNMGFLYDGGAKVIVECAKFYDSLLVKKVRSPQYEIWDIIGPDEYHERVNNNGYTNRMAKFTFEQAADIIRKCKTDKRLAECLGEYELDILLNRFEEDIDMIFIPKADNDGIIAQFDGYLLLEDVSLDEVRSRLLHEREYWGGAYGVASHTRIIKQADVITWMVMFPDDFDTEQKWKNWLFYEPRTEHGSSLSACMYGILACECGHQEEAYPFFMKSARADLEGGGKEWAGNVYIGGTHPAAAGGAYMTVINGFGGLKIKDGKITVTPRLPEKWNSLSFKIVYNGKPHHIIITKDSANVYDS